MKAILYKIEFFGFLFTFFFSCAVAQASFFPIGLGIQGGINQADAQTSGTVVESVSRTTPMGGVFADLNFSGPWYFQLEALFIDKGAKFHSGDQTVTDKLSYLEIPLLLKLQPNFLIFRPFAVIGPSFSMLRGAARETSTPSMTTTADVKAETRSTDLGMIVGAGVDLSVLPVVSAFISVRYDYGFTDVRKASEIEYQNRGFQELIGLRFSL